MAFVLALARPNSAHAFQPLDPNTWPFISVPEVATSPNGGTTYGLMGFRAIAIRSWLGLSMSDTATKASPSLAELTIPSEAYGWRNAIRIQKWKAVGLFGFPYRHATPGEMARHFSGRA